MLAPVIIFVYNRPEHTKKTIESLSKNFLAKETDIIIYSDGPKDQRQRNKVNNVREYIHSIESKEYFKSVKIIESSNNKGLALSVINGVSEVIKINKKVIVLEDDMLTSKDFLNFLNSSLDFYENNKNIWSISSYSLPIKIPKGYNKDIYLSYRAGSGGWGTWLDRWILTDWEISDYNNFVDNVKLRKKFNRGGNDMSWMLDNQVNGVIDSWAIRWCYSQFKNNMGTIYPVNSRIKNIGLDGSGTHSGLNPKYDVNLNDNFNTIKLEDIDYNNLIVKRLKRYYMNPLLYYVVLLKKKIKKFFSIMLHKKGD